MTDEFWATFSIYDHRHSALYRNSLILFDRVVIPVPTTKVGDLQPEEIEALAVDVDYLQQEGAAVRFDWDPAEFQEWQKKTIEHEGFDGEALAKVLVKDPPYATRLQLSQKYQEMVQGLLPPGVGSVTPVPVYGTRQRYESVVKDLWTAECKTLELVFNFLPMPPEDTPLSDIIDLRKRPQFQDSLYSLRKWQTKTVRELLQEKNDDRVIRAAARDLERYTQQYNEAMADARFKGIQTGVVSILALGGTLAMNAGPLIATLSAIAPSLFSLRELVRPCWKEVLDKECAPAGVIYAASRL